MYTRGEVMHSVDHLDRFHRRGHVELEGTVLHEFNLGTGGVTDQFLFANATRSSGGSSVA